MISCDHHCEHCCDEWYDDEESDQWPRIVEVTGPLVDEMLGGVR